MAAATGVSLTGPAAGSVNAPSALFTVALSPVGSTSAGDSVTPALTGIGGVITPAPPLVLSTATPSLTFTVTPSQTGVGTLTITDTAALTMGAPLTYTAFGPVLALQPLAGDGVTPNQGARVGVVPGTYVAILATIANLPAPITAASLAVGINAASQTLLTKAGILVDPGTLVGTTYTAKVAFICIETDTALLPANSAPYSGKVTVTASIGGTPRTLPAVNNLAWQSVGG